MLYAYFGGAGANGTARYELLLRHDGMRYTVLAEQHVPITSSTTARRPWLPCLMGQSSHRHIQARRLYYGRDALRALRTLLYAACAAANGADLGQRYCYVLPSVSTGGGSLAPLIPRQLRHNNALPEHPQLWQVGRPLLLLPHERHAEACPDRRMFGDERIAWAWA